MTQYTSPNQSLRGVPGGLATPNSNTVANAIITGVNMVVETGSGAPSGTAQVNSLYIDTTAGQVYYAMAGGSHNPLP